MSGVELLLLLGAGLVGGLTGSIAGLASLVTYPALLAVGLGPVAANVTNTVSLVFFERRLDARLAPRAGRARRTGCGTLALGAPLSGGAVGATLPCLTPSDTFEKLAPWLIGVASLAILLRPRVHPRG